MCIRDSYMDMPPVYVLVHIYNVRLIAIAHPLHILLGQFRELQIREPVIQRRVQRYMQDGLFCILVGKQVVVKRPQGLLHDTLRASCHIGNHAAVSYTHLKEHGCDWSVRFGKDGLIVTNSKDGVEPVSYTHL